MYDLGSDFANASVDPGTNILISGPPLTGKRRLAMTILAHGAAQGEGSVIVTTRDSADRVQADYLAQVRDTDGIDLGIVDCVTQHQGRSASDTELVKYASSPVDMTGIGIKFSEFVEEFYTQRNVRRNRILLDSLSTLMLYSDVQTVFRFMHVFTSRIEDADALGVHIIDSTAHETESVNTMKQLFDGVVEVDDDRNVSVQIPGVDATAVH